MFKETILHFFSLFLGVLFIIAGNGLLSMYFPIYAKSSVSAFEIGLITSAYYIGFFVGCFKILKLIRRVGFVRSFMFVGSLIGGAALLFTIIKSSWYWFPLRFIMGVGYAGLYVVIESWINALAQNKSRGRTYGIYRFVELGSLALGQNLIVHLEGQTGHFHFSMIALLTILSAIPLSLTLLQQPSISSEPVSFNVNRLWKSSQYSTGMIFFIGMTNSVIWMLTPLMLINSGVVEEEIPKVFFFFIFGGLLSQYPIGILSDRKERRSITNLLILFSCMVAYLLTLSHYFMFQLEFLFFLFGVSVMPLYSLIMTHAMDRVEQNNSSRISSQMLLLYSGGAICGPVTCSIFINYFSKNGYSYYLVTIFVFMFVFGIIQRLKNPPVEEEDKEKFKVFPELTPSIFLLKKNKSRPKV